jgi:hypothetical protein
MSYELVEYRNDYWDHERNAPWDWEHERNAGFGDEWRNAWVTRRNPRTGRFERVWVPDAAPRPVVVQPRPQPVVVQQQPAAPAPQHHHAHTAPANVTCGKSPFRNEMGQVRTGVIIDAIAQTLAAFAALPPAPTPSGDIATDQANGITFLAALAQHAKTDEKIRTVSKLVQLFVTN